MSCVVAHLCGISFSKPTIFYFKPERDFILLTFSDCVSLSIDRVVTANDQLSITQYMFCHATKQDPVTRQNSGVGWVLMADEESVTKAIDYYMSGEVNGFFSDGATRDMWGRITLALK